MKYGVSKFKIATYGYFTGRCGNLEPSPIIWPVRCILHIVTIPLHHVQGSQNNGHIHIDRINKIMNIILSSCFIPYLGNSILPGRMKAVSLRKIERGISSVLIQFTLCDTRAKTDNILRKCAIVWSSFRNDHQVFVEII